MNKKAITHAQRAAYCRQAGVPNTGRQWRKLRKRLGLAVRAPVGARTTSIKQPNAKPYNAAALGAALAAVAAPALLHRGRR